MGRRSLGKRRAPGCGERASMQTNDYLELSCSAPGYFSPAECERVIALSAGLAPMDGGVLEDGRAAPDTRRSTIRALARDARTGWVYDKLERAVAEVNRQYRFDVSGIEEMQLARYGPGHFYDWHMDIGKGVLSTRKLSVSLQLSDPAAYDGGDLEIQYRDEGPAAKAIGTVIVFPSYLSHRVTPVTRGERWSLVAWVHGPPFR